MPIVFNAMSVEGNNDVMLFTRKSDYALIVTNAVGI